MTKKPAADEAAAAILNMFSVEQNHFYQYLTIKNIFHFESLLVIRPRVRKT